MLVNKPSGKFFKKHLMILTISRIKIFIISIFYLLSNYYSNAQTFTFKHTIDWKKNQTIVNNETEISKTFLYFKNACYPNIKSGLPNFYTKYDVKNLKGKSYDYKAEIQIIKSEQINLSDLKLFNNWKKSDLPKITSSQYKTREKEYVQIYIEPFYIANSKIYKITEFQIVIKSAKKAKSKTNTFITKQNSVLNSGKWIKIAIPKDGIYKISYSKLKDLGFTNPEEIRIFGNDHGMLSFKNSDPRPDDLTENKIYKNNELIYFYAKGPHKWIYDTENEIYVQKKHLYANYAYYFLTDKNTSQNNYIENANLATEPPTETYTTYNEFLHHETDTFNLLRSGRQWFGEHFYLDNTKTISFSTPHINNSYQHKAKISIIARSGSSSSMNISLGNVNNIINFSSVCSNVTCEYAKRRTQKILFNNNEENINVQLTYNKPSYASEAWLDYITLNITSNLNYTNKQLIFRNTESVEKNKISQFQINNTNENVIIWDITEPTNPKNIKYEKTSNQINFKYLTEELKEFIAFQPSDAYDPIFEGENLGEIKNQNIHAAGDAELLIVTHPDFLQQANQLADIHREYDDFAVHVFTTEQIYNEFSCGAPDVSAIRDCARMLYNKTADGKFRYLLLFGDGSVDNKNNTNNNTNFIPTYQSENSLNDNIFLTFVSDDFFGLLDENEGEYNGLLDLGIGRIPVKNQIEATNAVNKIRYYLDEQSKGDWRNLLCFIADDEDNNIHISQANQIADFVGENYPQYNIDKIYLDAFPQVSSPIGPSYPTVTDAINNRIKQGALIMNYTGHGGVKGLAHERIVLVNDILNWQNKYNLPLFITASCEFSRFDDYYPATDENKTSAGEYVFLNEKGGAIALYSTTRLVYSSPNFRLNLNIFKHALNHNTNNKKTRLGDIIRIGKIETNDYNMLNFILLGDPALALPYPELKANISKINDIPVSLFNDTIKALSKVTINGNIMQNNNIQKKFNGIIQPTVFDKKTEVNTLNNDGDGVFTFETRNKKIYKGRASVKNGQFAFEFIVPKDIAYNIDSGKISLYAYNSEYEAIGYTKDILIGAGNNEISNDTKGPEIDIYLNDKNFVNGGMTDKNPTILAFLKDSSGINTIGSGIGHDITVILDDDPNKIYVLNDSYEAELDSYKKGKIEYALSEIEEGAHRLKIKAWDVLNNSSEQELDFIVVDNKNLTIKHLFNYPNPFTSHTSFFFEHNQANETIEFSIEIFSVSGKIIKTISGTINSTGFRTEPIYWDGKDDYGNRIGKGVYFYRLSVRTTSGKKIEKYQKLLYLK